MEPGNVNSSANDDRRIEALLRDAVTPLPDDGFSARVMAALPGAEKQPATRRRLAFCLAGAMCGCAFALWRGVSVPELEAAYSRFAPSLMNAASPLADPVLATALMVAALSLLFAFRAELRDRLMS